MTCVLLIRPLQEALPLAKALEAKRIKSCLYPLFKPHFLPLLPLKTPQALIITSKNALRAIKEQENLKTIPLYAVGDQTAQLAQDLGFSKVFSASGTSQELIQLISHHARPEGEILWHLSGEIIKDPIVETLRTKGFKAERRIVYRIEGTEDIPPPLLSDLQHRRISHVMFFSPHTTTLFVNLLQRNGLGKETGQMISLCLSHDIAKKAQALRWKTIWISSKPTAQEIMEYFNEKR